MYKQAVLENPTILKTYVLAPTNDHEWLVALHPVPIYKPADELPNKPEKKVVAVYRPTGRLFVEHNKRAWEYEYIGIRIYE